MCYKATWQSAHLLFHWKSTQTGSRCLLEHHCTSTIPQYSGANRADVISDGLDFGHGVGHGVGSYLAVHESGWDSLGGRDALTRTTGPMFSRGTSFEPGHVTTIEPGFYKEGEFGVRIESVLLCKKIAVSLSLSTKDLC